MAVQNRTISVYPDETAVALCGGYRSPALNRAIESWARQLREADLSGLDRQDWGLLAASWGAADWDRAIWPGALAQEVHDYIELRGGDVRWYGSEADELRQSMAKLGINDVNPLPPDATPVQRGQRLVRAIATMTQVQVEAVVATLCWFWTQPDIDVHSDEWWTPAFRVRRELGSAGRARA